MRLTNKLYAQHLGWMFKKHWQVQGKRVPYDTGARSELEKFGIHVKDPSDVLMGPKQKQQSVDIVGFKEKELLEDESHPNWNQTLCYIYGNNNVVLEGVPQAQLLVKAVEISGLPKNVEEAITRIQLPSTIDRSVQNAILASHVYDAEQVKLPKIKVPGRPMLNLPRVYGISLERRCRLLLNKLIFECDKLAGITVNSSRRLIDNAQFSVTIPREDKLLQFEVNAEKMITATRAIEPVKSRYDGDLPDLYPIKCTISIPQKNIYTTETRYPISRKLNFSHPHTIFSYFNKEYVGNLHETPVTNSQFQSRTLLKAFAVAAARAKQLYGEDAFKSLPKPIVVQSIQTDGRVFHLGVFQLNTLNVDDQSELKNYWFHVPNMELFSECGYKEGRPTLEGYNKDVFRYLNAFYNNS